MRLYLSSLSFEPRSLSEFLGPSPRVGLIANALDFLPPFPRHEAVTSTLNSLGQISDATEIDLRRYFKDPSGLAASLEQVDALWVSGGSCFLLAAALSRSGAAPVISRRVRTREINYAGSSAGAVVASTSLAPATTCEDPQVVRQIYHSAPVYTGLALLTLTVIPHFAEIPAKDALPTNLMRDYCKASGIDFLTISDGSAIVVEDQQVTEITFAPDVATLF